MLASEGVRHSVEVLIRDTLTRLSTPGSEFADLFCDPDLVVVGSGVGELFVGPDVVCRVGAGLATAGFKWTPGDITIWQQGDVAWAQIHCDVIIDSGDAVPYITTGVFAKVDGEWRWKYWGGSEPQAQPRV